MQAQENRTIMSNVPVRRCVVMINVQEITTNVGVTLRAKYYRRENEIYAVVESIGNDAEAVEIDGSNTLEGAQHNVKTFLASVNLRRWLGV